METAARPTCSVESCDRPAKTRGWCQTHYMRWQRTGQVPTGPIGSLRKEPERCVVEGCDRAARIGEMCAPHGKRLARNGDPGPAQIQTKAGNNKGRERRVQSNGYVWVKAPGHPNAYSTGQMLEHTFVMSELLGRPLVQGENVHHKNGVRSDNRPENLELWLEHQPKGARISDLLPWARELIERYGDVPPEVLG